MTELKTRVRWTEEERRLLAEEMVRLLQADPRQSKLQSLIRAQQALPEARRRTVAAWTMVREQIEPHIRQIEQAATQAAAARAAADAQAADGPQASGPSQQASGFSQPAESLQAMDDEPGSPMAASAASLAASVAAAQSGAAADQAASEDGLGATAGGLSGQIARQLEALARLGTQALEAAVLQVLSSPAVAERLEALVRGALVNGASAASAAAAAPAASAPAEPPAQPARAVAMPRPKVLVAGPTPAQANELAEEFSESLDLRNWRPGETKDQLRSLGRVCSVAVLMTDALDHDAESTLKSMHLRIVKHSGGLARLKERLHELVDSGMFNVLT